MPSSTRNTFKKSERLCSRLLMERLFQGDSKSVSAYPMRAVFLPVDKSVQQGVSVLISVPKKRFHDAVDRNRVKRQIREAYRKLKHSLVENMVSREEGLLIAFIYVSAKIEPTAYVEKRMSRLLEKISEAL
ncbi:MAG: ribonuclease P protein component [Bacteroidaceae bacterium]|nr:ribonuclease P protein component [Bacteroidaceae bacterium]MBR5847483.1 ribonuclease P protein component [Bacteroidaceae bacterium]